LRPCLEKTLHKKGLVKWLKVKALSSNLSTAKKKERNLLCQLALWPNTVP
jgi:hypothetical protein